MMFFFLFASFLIYVNCLRPIPENITYNDYKNFKINETVEYILQVTGNVTDLQQNPIRITTSCENNSNNYPLLIVVKQRREILSWQLPLLVENDANEVIGFQNSSRTLCPVFARRFHSTGSGINDVESPVITVSSTSTENVAFNIKVEEITNFHVEVHKEISVKISPSEPQYFFYSFGKNKTKYGKFYDMETVVLKVTSEDDICMTVSIQNASCPIYDLNHDIKFEGLYETVDRKGGMTISNRKFPNGFFIVMVAHPDDSDCQRSMSVLSPNRTKTLSFFLIPSVSMIEYVQAVGITLGIIFAFYVVFYFSIFCYWRYSHVPPVMESVEGASTESETAVATTTTSAVPMMSLVEQDNISFDDNEYDTIQEAANKDILLGKAMLCLQDLARKDPRILKRKSIKYLWHVLTVALFYGLPVVQLVVTYQYMLNDTGNQDLCYYNFLCAHPLGILSDFNHLFSNIGYVLFGLLFLIIVRRKEKQHNDLNFDKFYGIPQHYGLFYALGVALIMEGVLSGSYHLCPNHMNFQFDSSFMYIMAVLCMIKLYQTRHPDINASAYTTFGVLAVTIFIGMIGVLAANLTFWIIFTIVHILTCLTLTIQVYYLGNYTLGRESLRRRITTFVYDLRSGPINVFKPNHTARMVLLVLGNVVNLVLAILGVYYHEKDFARHLLKILLSNTMLYFTFYIVMKLVHGEKIKMQTFLFLIFMVAFGISAMYFFKQKSISWALTPAGSRRFNKECRVLNFYDFHDVWHFLSAVGMFFTFMVLLTLDDDLSHTHRSKIYVF